MSKIKASQCLKIVQNVSFQFWNNLSDVKITLRPFCATFKNYEHHQRAPGAYDCKYWSFHNRSLSPSQAKEWWPRPMNSYSMMMISSWHSDAAMAWSSFWPLRRRLKKTFWPSPFQCDKSCWFANNILMASSS